MLKLFALVTRRPYCPGGPKKLCFTTLSLIPTISIARLSLVKQRSFGLPGQYGRRVTRVNWLKNWREAFHPITQRSNRNRVIMFDSHEEASLIELSSNDGHVDLYCQKKISWHVQGRREEVGRGGGGKCRLHCWRKCGHGSKFSNYMTLLYVLT